jgi:hypothetical protein
VTFLNKKEEVIDLILTTKGREKLSKNRFKPHYYEFYDNEIIYDGAYISTGSVEAQNQIAGRIREALISKNQSSWQAPISGQEASQETGDGQAMAMLINGKVVNIDTPEFVLKGKSFLIEREPYFYEMGESNPFSQQKPAWFINFLKGSITGSVKHVPLEKNIPLLQNYFGEKIPQLNAFCKYQVYIAYDENKWYIMYDRSSDDLLTSIFEVNELDKSENFEVEVYQYEHDPNNSITNLRPLYFEGSEYTDEYVEYYFDVAFDKAESLEIDYVEALNKQKELIKEIEGEC